MSAKKSKKLKVAEARYWSENLHKEEQMHDKQVEVEECTRILLHQIKILDFFTKK